MAPLTSAPAWFRSVRLALAVGALAAFLAVSPLSADDGDKSSAKPPAGKTLRDTGAVEIRFTDSSTMRLSLREERIEVATRYGKLLVPVAELHRIDFATRIDDDAAQKIEV